MLTMRRASSRLLYDTTTVVRTNTPIIATKTNNKETYRLAHAMPFSLSAARRVRAKAAPGRIDSTAR